MLKNSLKKRSIRKGARRLLARLRGVRLAASVLAVGAVVVAGAVALLLRAPEMGDPALDAAEAQGAGVVEVSVACDGWTRENVDLGVFASGFGLDGTKVDEHAVLEGPGTCAVTLARGFYEISLQVPRIMVEDGTVLVAGDPAVACLDDLAEACRLEVAYEPVDAPGGYDDLQEIALDSFVDQAVAEQALSRARERYNGEGG